MILTIDTEKLNPLRLIFPRKKEEEDLEEPNQIRISYTQEALSKGTLDDFNKRIQVIVDGFVVEEKFPYSKIEAEALSEVYGLVINDLTEEEDDEDFEFEESFSLEGYISDMEEE